MFMASTKDIWYGLVLKDTPWTMTSRQAGAWSDMVKACDIDVVTLEEGLQTNSGSAVPYRIYIVERTLTNIFVIHPC
jgi:hypothetical protein